jgi:hypothetical protein
MFPLPQEPSFLAYTYESDDDVEKENDRDNNMEEEDCCSLLCGCDDGDDDKFGRENSLRVHETTPLVSSNARSAAPQKKMSAAAREHRRRRSQTVGSITLAVSIVLVLFECSYFDLRRLHSRFGKDPTALEASLMVSVSSSGTSAETMTTTTAYGKVWLIRHGEKDPLPPPFAEREVRLRAMYELNARGWNRAHHLASLVEQGEWPQFSALFATRPATSKEVSDAYPDFARDATGQSLIKREYQTLLPLSKVLFPHNSTRIHSEFAKGDIESAALEITKTAVAANSKNASPVVLVSWDHCSLPTLVVNGFGCDSNSDPRCSRCWSDDRFGDVLKLNVSLVTTTTISATAKGSSTEATADTISCDYTVSSTIHGMTGEAYPADQYYKTPASSNDSGSSGLAMDKMLSANTPMSIAKSTPCAHSYCTKRPASKHLVSCSCWDDEDVEASPVVRHTSSTTTTKKTAHGEVWVIRHGEKDPLPSHSALASATDVHEREERIRIMYELNARGWDRAHHLATLVEKGDWPEFSTLFATRPATQEEALEAYPNLAYDSTGQPMIRREYQTLLPLSKVLLPNNTMIHARYTKGEVEPAALEITKSAVASAHTNRSVVLVAWNHCSLPTLVVQGFGCRGDPHCYRCWLDLRYGDVLKLNVTLETTTSTRTTAREGKEIVSNDYAISSTILGMTGESYVTDHYFAESGSGSSSDNSSIVSALMPTSIEKTTPCTQSYCSKRPAFQHEVRCLCWQEEGEARPLFP